MCRREEIPEIVISVLRTSVIYCKFMLCTSLTTGWIESGDVSSELPCVTLNVRNVVFFFYGRHMHMSYFGGH